jgi:LacI family transcriptional regulator
VLAVIRDVARLADVSIGTVSYLMSGTHFVSGPRHERILSAMQQPNYQPSTIARSLRTKARHTIGLIVSDIDLPCFATLARGVQDAFSQALCRKYDAVYADRKMPTRWTGG